MVHLRPGVWGFGEVQGASVWERWGPHVHCFWQHNTCLHLILGSEAFFSRGVHILEIVGLGGLLDIGMVCQFG